MIPPTPRQTDVLRLVARGWTLDAIADDLGIGRSTVRQRMDEVVRRLGAANRCHAVAIAYEVGILGGGR